MSLELEPSDLLLFPRPLADGPSVLMKVHNTGDELLAFKVKTTAPRHYCVRPNAGLIGPGDSLSIEVTLQPLKTEPADNATCKDKFLVQSIPVIGNLTKMDLSDLWTHVEANLKNEIRQNKLKCAYMSNTHLVNKTSQVGTAVASQQAEIKNKARQEASSQEDSEVARMKKKLAEYQQEIAALRKRTVEDESKRARYEEGSEPMIRTQVIEKTNGYPPHIVVLLIALTAVAVWYFMNSR
ncbi:PapD-like protein [Radiomyces spectabilis]|uniref:PapD-like protein n=1 Tax=Radiomyces spectabilis TaxID=64574 RepID=UPI0022203B74|nr:PapD-like protein [Radiomyces spectabilis]KAI8364783.1 PapD-like protein [Radiomyces spectabilis]